MEIKILSRNDLFGNSHALSRVWHTKYLAMFSTVYDGIVTDPELMMVPVDDHMVHRGDAVFDVAKCYEGAVYQLDGHLDRLLRSAEAISIKSPYAREAIKNIAVETIRVGGVPDCIVRISISRGAGGFSVNPNECHRSELYVVVMRSPEINREFIEKGLTLISSEIPIKPSFFARVKSCNYLPNVLMSLEAQKAGANYSVAFDEKGCLAESASENIAIVTRDMELLIPKYDRILRGLTVSRAAQLAGGLVESGELKSVKTSDIKAEDAYEASEVLILGTSIHVLPVVRFDGRTIGAGSPGPIFNKLRECILQDMTTNEEMSTRVFF